MLTPPAATRCPAEALLHPSRLDVVVKYLLFRSLLTQDEPRVLALYERHIARRTGGFEDGKRTVSDYVSAARDLLGRLQSHGFDAATPVRIGGRNGLPLDGAHRIGACLALGFDVVVEIVDEGWGATWGDDWFRSHGFPPDDVDLLVRTYARLSARSIVFIFWGPARDRWEELGSLLSSETAVVAVADRALDPADTITLVQDIYARRLGPSTNARIADKARALGAGPAAIRAILVDAPRHVADLAAFSTALKARLRTIAGAGADDFWTTVHASDDAAEAQYLTDIIFSGNYWRMLALRRDAVVSQTFLHWLDAYVRILASHHIDPDDTCIVGSAVLEAIGVRQATDIDCIVGRREPQFHGGVVALGAGVDLVTRGYHRRADGGPTCADAEVIADPRLHFRMRGLKFANPEIVIDRKRQHRRPKDLADVALWERRAVTGIVAPRPRRVVLLVTTDPVDVMRHAAIEAMRDERARLGDALVVAGVPSTPASLTVPCIEGPPGADDLPAELFLEDDPCATLASCGAEPAALLEAVCAEAGPASDPGRTFRRLRSLAWTARWMRAWLEALRPGEIIVENLGVTGLLLRSVSGEVGPAACPPDMEGIARACRDATEQIRIAAAVRRTLPVEDVVTVSSREQAWWQAAAESHCGSLWLWGAGALGRTASAWLAGLSAPVAGVVDTDPAKHGMRLGNVLVAPPSVLREVPAGTLRVAVTSVHAGAIMKALCALGVSMSGVIVLAGAPPSRD